MRRRAFLAAVGSAVAWPRIADAQPRTATLGFLHSSSPNYFRHFLPVVLGGLAEAGYAEGRNLVVEYRWAEGQYDRLPGLAADLVARGVGAILAAGGSDPARAAKAATASIPIVFVSAADPVRAGLVASLSRPGANVTGISLIGAALEAKRMEILREVAPDVKVMGALVNPNYPAAQAQAAEIQEGAQQLGLRAVVREAASPEAIEAAFAGFAQEGAKAVLVASDPYFNSRREQLVGVAARFAFPAVYSQREYAEAGGLVTYAPNYADGYRQGGVYAGQVLGGAKPAELPVLQPARFELVVNNKTAKSLGVTIPPTILARADEVIE